MTGHADQPPVTPRILTMASRTWRGLLAGGALITGTLIIGTLPTVAQAPAWAVTSAVRPVPSPRMTPAPHRGRPPSPFALSVGSASGQPVAGHEYRFYVSVTGVSVPAVNIALQIWFTPGVTMAVLPPPGCIPAPGGLDCDFGELDVGQTLTLGLTVTVAAGLPASAQTGVSALLRYDWIWWGYASASRPVAVPPPPAAPPPPAKPRHHCHLNHPHPWHSPPHRPAL